MCVQGGVNSEGKVASDFCKFFFERLPSEEECMFIVTFVYDKRCLRS